MSTKLFISYHRDDTGATAGEVAAGLRGVFGSDSVAIDIRDVEHGVSFVEELKGILAGVDAVIAVIGPDWSRRVCAGADDWVRQELEAARSLGVRVVPVLVQGAPFPRYDGIPNELGWLRLVNACSLEPGAHERGFEAIARAVRNPKRVLSEEIYRNLENELEDRIRLSSSMFNWSNRWDNILVLGAVMFSLAVPIAFLWGAPGAVGGTIGILPAGCITANRVLRLRERAAWHSKVELELTAMRRELQLYRDVEAVHIRVTTRLSELEEDVGTFW